MLGRGSGGRIILLGDGTEILTDHPHDDDGDVDMEDRGEAEELEDKDLEEQVRKGQADAKKEGANGERGAREETPGPSGSETTETPEEVKSESPEQAKSATPAEPKISVPIDGADSKKDAEEAVASK